MHSNQSCILYNRYNTRQQNHKCHTFVPKNKDIIAGPLIKILDIIVEDTESLTIVDMFLGRSYGHDAAQ